MIKYIGSKRVLVPAIVELVRTLPSVETVLDLFSGTSRVGHGLKRAGYRVIANDHNAYASALARCYVQSDLETLGLDAEKLIRELDALPGRAGYFTETFCVKSRFFQPKNGARVDAIREHIAQCKLGPELEAVALTSLIEAADRVDSTTGVQMAYLKDWAPRSFNDLRLRVPELLSRSRFGPCVALERDALDAARTVGPVDVAYLDPPYNQHKYLGNYHVWESLVRWDKPLVYGTACKRLDCRDRTSAFNSKRLFIQAFREIVSSLKARWVIVSFNNEGFLSRSDAEEILSALGAVRTFEHDFKRYVGAQIGIYNPSGTKVGTVGRLRNKEFLYIVGPHTKALETQKTQLLLPGS